MAKKKADKPEKKDEKPKGQINTLPDGSILDLATLPIGDIKLTDKETRFVFWYTYPGTEAFQNQTRAAVMAGYERKYAFAQGYKLKNKENVAAAIKAILDTKLKADLGEEYHKIIEKKKIRAHFDIGDYVRARPREVTGKGPDGEPETVIITAEDLKDLSELTPEQRMAIDGIDYKGPQAVKVYLFADRERAMTDLINLYQKLNGPIDENAYDFEATTEIIKGQLAMKIAVRRKKDEIAKEADFMKSTGPLIEEL
jgi:phage terminase small subunit